MQHLQIRELEDQTLWLALLCNMTFPGWQRAFEPIFQCLWTTWLEKQGALEPCKTLWCVSTVNSWSYRSNCPWVCFSFPSMTNHGIRVTWKFEIKKKVLGTPSVWCVCSFVLAKIFLLSSLPQFIVEWCCMTFSFFPFLGGSHVPQAGLQITVPSRLALNPWWSLLNLPCTAILSYILYGSSSEIVKL